MNPNTTRTTMTNTIKYRLCSDSAACCSSRDAVPLRSSVSDRRARAWSELGSRSRARRIARRPCPARPRTSPGSSRHQRRRRRSAGPSRCALPGHHERRSLAAARRSRCSRAPPSRRGSRFAVPAAAVLGGATSLIVYGGSAPASIRCPCSTHKAACRAARRRRRHDGVARHVAAAGRRSQPQPRRRSRLHVRRRGLARAAPATIPACRAAGLGGIEGPCHRQHHARAATANPTRR